jgi:hypothetical protein
VKFILLLAPLFLLVAACGRSGASEPLPTAPARGSANGLPTVQKPTGAPTAVPDSFNGDSLISNATLGALLSAISTCSATAGADKTAYLACVDKQMTAAHTSDPVMAFFRETGYWLIGFTEAGRIDMANVLATEVGTSPQIAILGPGRDLQTIADLFAAKYPAAATDHASPFRGDAKYQALVSAVQAKTPGTNPDLRHYTDAQIETAQQMATAPRFIIELGIANGCMTCGTGVAARYSFTFDLKGKLTETSFLGLCQGRAVTRNTIAGPITLHEFATQNGTATGLTEPYRVVVPGLMECPPHLDF